MDAIPGQAWISPLVFWRLPKVVDAVGGSETAKVSLRSFLARQGLIDREGRISLTGAESALSQWRQARSSSKRSSRPKLEPVRVAQVSSGLGGYWDVMQNRFIRFRSDDDSHGPNTC